ncbi:hypothetical protein M433DRAFT_131980 [Acidomyces richmondensis BFW]|nr:MAG: hypothetical protein FE78DRAFT_74707 [Acidomyces sp. 'richmondensis']KYG48575.1 hypothetical protein M433DRAFT_131980 [Acidomyces richmondensis BFW]
MKSGNGPADDGDSSAINSHKRGADLGESQLPQKRSRVSRACDQCRASREKCDGIHPKCHSCISQKRECSYNDQPKKRGIQPNYIRTLELIIAWLFRSAAGSEGKLAVHLASVADAVHRAISAKDPGDAESLHQRWRNSIVCRQIDQILSGASIERPSISGASPSNSAVPELLEIQADKSSTTDAMASKENFVSTHSTVGYGNGSVGEGQASIVRQSSIPAPNLNPHQDRQDMLDRALDPSTCQHNNISSSWRVKLPENTWTLLEYYFAFTHAWLPIIEKETILKLVYKYPSEGVPRDVASEISSGYHELWTILSLSALQLIYAGQTQLRETHENLREVTYASISLDTECTYLSHLRTILLHVLIEITSQNWGKAWLLVGRVIRLSLALDAGNASDDRNVTDTKTIKLAAFVLEVAIAHCLGICVVHLRPEQIDKLGLMDEDGSDEWEAWHDPFTKSLSKSPAMSLSTFNRLVRLTTLLFNAQHLSNASQQAPGPLYFATHQQNRTSTPSFGSLRSQTLPAYELAFSPGSNATNASFPQNIIVALVKNATQAQGRLQPSSVLSAFENNQFPGSVANSVSDHLPHGYVSIPNEIAESVLSSSPGFFPEAGEEKRAWPFEEQSSNILPSNLHSASIGDVGSGVDIFEELALLERTDSSQHPQFMQNLGFGPDLDLAEFFGADYQPSDPLLAYLQPSTFSLSAATSDQRTVD